MYEITSRVYDSDAMNVNVKRDFFMMMMMMKHACHVNENEGATPEIQDLL